MSRRGGAAQHARGGRRREGRGRQGPVHVAAAAHHASVRGDGGRVVRGAGRRLVDVVERGVERQPGAHPQEHVCAQPVARRPEVEITIT